MGRAWTVEVTSIFFLVVMGLLIGFVYDVWIFSFSLADVTSRGVGA